MPFTVEDFHDLIRLLETRPEWREEIRRLVLTHELLALPELVRSLAVAQQHTEQQVAALAAAQERTEARLHRLTDEVGVLKGDALERRYRERAFAYFASLVRRPHVVFGDELVDLLTEAIAQGRLSEAEANEVAQADVIVHGRRREDDSPVYLVVEVSWGVGPSDVRRAAERAVLLSRMGVLAMPVVAGARVVPEAQTLARELKVLQVTDGQVFSAEVAEG